MSDIKVHYYGAAGRAEQLRLALLLAGKPFSNVVPGEEGIPGFLAACREKGGNMTTNVPMLEVDGKFYPQSQAALRYIGRKFNLYSGDPEKAYEADKLIADAEDLRDLAYKCCDVPAFGMSSTKALVDKMKADRFPTHLANLERLLGSKDFFGGASPSIADASVYDVLANFIRAMFPTSLDEYPALTKYCERVAAFPAIKAHEESSERKAFFAFSPESVPKE